MDMLKNLMFFDLLVVATLVVAKIYS